MSNSEKTIPTWGFHATKPAKIFDLKEGEGLPAGWEDTPAAFLPPEEDEDTKTSVPIAEHRGGGRWYVIVNGEPVGEAMNRADAEAFNALSDADKAALIAKA